MLAKQQYAVRAKDVPAYKIGDIVWLANQAQKKLQAKFIGPYVIKEVRAGGLTYTVRCLGNHRIRSDTTAHQDQLKSCKIPEDAKFHFQDMMMSASVVRSQPDSVPDWQNDTFWLAWHFWKDWTVYDNYPIQEIPSTTDEALSRWKAQSLLLDCTIDHFRDLLFPITEMLKSWEVLHTYFPLDVHHNAVSSTRGIEPASTFEDCSIEGM